MTAVASALPMAGIGAQARSRARHVIPRGAYIGAVTLRAFCLEERAVPETVSVEISFGRHDNVIPPWWPWRLPALIQRVRPDDIRFGTHFTRFRLIRVSFDSGTVRGNLGELWPDSEDMSAATGPKFCFPKGLGFKGTVTAPIAIESSNTVRCRDTSRYRDIRPLPPEIQCARRFTYLTAALAHSGRRPSLRSRE